MYTLPVRIYYLDAGERRKSSIFFVLSIVVIHKKPFFLERKSIIIILLTHSTLPKIVYKYIHFPYGLPSLFMFALIDSLATTIRTGAGDKNILPSA